MANFSKGNIAEAVAICGIIDPDVYTAAAYTSSIIDMQDFREVMFVVMAGTLGTSATLDCLVKGSTASNMASPANLTGKAITQLTEAGTDSDKQAVIRVTAEEVAAQGYRYVQATMTVATATSDAGLIVIGFPAHYSDAADVDLAAVDEIVM